MRLLGVRRWGVHEPAWGGGGGGREKRGLGASCPSPLPGSVKPFGGLALQAAED